MVGPKRFGPIKSTGYPPLGQKSVTFFVGDSQSDNAKVSANGKSGAEHALLSSNSDNVIEGRDGENPALQERLKTIYANSKRWGIENRRLRESIARGDIVVVYEERELCLSSQGT